MGNKQKQTKQATGTMPRESSQVDTHGQPQSKDWSQGQGSQNKGQGQYQGKGQPLSPDRGTWNDRAQRERQQGDETRPAQPSGTSPLDKDQHPVNQTRPVQQNR